MIDALTINIETIEELDDFLHQKVIEDMKARENGEEVVQEQPVKIIFSENLLKMGMEVITEMVMMKSVERALSDPYVNNYPKDKVKVHESVTYENTILQILSGNRKVTYH